LTLGRSVITGAIFFPEKRMHAVVKRSGFATVE
jgi:hypothetical protein